jgi:chromosome segregation ATPase
VLKNEQARYWGFQAVLLLLAVLAAGQLTAYAQDDAALKSEWQNRVLDAKKRLADAEGRLAEVDQKKNDLTSQWGASGAALPPQDVMDEINRVEAEHKAAADAVTSLRNEIDTVIPEEARKAGIPPGWLRDVQ